MTITQTFQQHLRPLILDGAIGTHLQHLHLTETDYRGKQFATHPLPLFGNHDILNITQPQHIANIHQQYLEAGADIITTNTFLSQPISQQQYKLSTYTPLINTTAVHIARQLANQYTNLTPSKPRFVIASIGPTTLTPTNNHHYQQLLQTYHTQIETLINTPIDALLIETITNTTTAQAAIQAAHTAMQQQHRTIPIILTATITPSSPSPLHTLLPLIPLAQPLAIGINCTPPTPTLLTHLQQLATHTHLPLILQPSAGLPDTTGHYTITPQTFAQNISTYLRHLPLAAIGGCCGTTPQHIQQLANLIP